MKALPKDFLEEIAIYCELTGKQAEAFIAFYSSNKNKETVAKDLNISPSALYQRLVRVYENIGNSEDDNKIECLRSLLWEKYQRQDDICIYYLYKLEKIKVAREQNLKQLNLSNRKNNFTKKLLKIPNEIFELSHLTQLDLSENQITELSEALGNLTNLTQLDLSHNQITKLPEALGNLTNLTQLDLSRNRIINLPKTIGNLTNLIQLDLSCNRIINLPKTIGNLTSLIQLNLSGTRIINLPEPILIQLKLFNNQIEKLPKSISNLTNLTELYLSGNQLKKLPESIDKLSSLRKLNLSRNQITELPESLGNLTNLTELDLQDNPLENPPLEIAENGIEAIREYFRQIAEEGEDYIYEAKLLIIGEAGAGKTTLANKIQDADYELPQETNSTSTEGIDVIKWKFSLENQQEFCINIWDFGGQEIYHATHQFFLTKRSLYTLVSDNRKEDTDFYYWLNVVELLSDNSPLLIVNNEKLERKSNINEKALRGQFDNLVEILSSNFKTNRGLEKILSKIKHYIQHLPHIGQALPKTWIRVRQALENNSRNHITLNEYLDICQKNGFNLHKDKLQLSNYLHDLGVCLHFQDEEDSLLYKTIILKPEWGTAAVYTVLDNQTVKDNQGCFTREDLKTIWHQETYATMRGELLELMKRFQLCYEIPSHKNTFIAPQLLSENQPDYEWNNSNNLILRYSYPDFMPKGIITRFIVVMHQYIDRDNYVWKTGVILSKDRAKAEVIEYYGRRIIAIRISGSNKRDLMTIVTHEIDKISNSFRRLKYQKLIPCNCKICKLNPKPHLYAFDKLKRFIIDRQQRIQCQESYEMVEVTKLIDDVIIWNIEEEDINNFRSGYPQEAFKKYQVKNMNQENINQEIYISYSWSDESKAIVDLIDDNFQDRGIEIIRDIKNINYKDSIRNFMQNLGRGKCIIVILSKKYLESPNCMFELIEIANNDDFHNRIFPIVLKDSKIYNPVDRIKYIKYWQDESKELNQAMKDIEDQSNLQGIREDLDLYTQIRHTIAKLTDILRDMNALTPDTHLESEFKELFESIENKLRA